MLTENLRITGSVLLLPGQAPLLTLQGICLLWSQSSLPSGQRPACPWWRRVLEMWRLLHSKVSGEKQKGTFWKHLSRKGQWEKNQNKIQTGVCLMLQQVRTSPMDTEIFACLLVTQQQRMWIIPWSYIHLFRGCSPGLGSVMPQGSWEWIFAAAENRDL